MVCLSQLGSTQDVSTCLLKTFLGLAAPSILPFLLLPPDPLPWGHSEGAGGAQGVSLVWPLACV